MVFEAVGIPQRPHITNGLSISRDSHLAEVVPTQLDSRWESKACFSRCLAAKLVATTRKLVRRVANATPLAQRMPFRKC